tara:strand:+ start:1758 stop:2498 length:741 start_codon:yes stop_codon:yes gene_type:complete
MINQINVFNRSLSDGQKAGVASIVQLGITYPIDTAIKQIQAGKKIKNIFKYKGFIPSSINFPLSRFIGFEIVSRLKSDTSIPKPFASTYGAIISGIIKPCITYPLDVFKIQLQTETAKTITEAFKNIKHIPHKKHLNAIKFFQSRTIVGYFCWFNTQDIYKSEISSEKTLMNSTLSGALSGLTTAILIQPLEIGKINNQIGNPSNLSQLYRSHGISRFYSTNLFVFTAIRQVINGIIFNNIYESLK